MKTGGGDMTSLLATEERCQEERPLVGIPRELNDIITKEERGGCKRTRVLPSFEKNTENQRRTNFVSRQREKRRLDFDRLRIFSSLIYLQGDLKQNCSAIKKINIYYQK